MTPFPFKLSVYGIIPGLVESYTADSVRFPLAVVCCPRDSHSISLAVEKHGCVHGRRVWGTGSLTLEKLFPMWPSLQLCIPHVEQVVHYEKMRDNLS